MKAQERKCLGCGARHIYPFSKSCSNGCDAGYTVVDDVRNNGKPVKNTGLCSCVEFTETVYIEGRRHCKICGLPETENDQLAQSDCYHSFPDKPVEFPVYQCEKCGKLSK